ncbi:MAG: hypothetical protein AAF226_04125 [Verrucomicrobiota bacterium]
MAPSFDVAQSRNNQRTPEQERTALLQRLTINRTNAGILEERIKARRAEEARAKVSPEANEKRDPPKVDEGDKKKPDPAELIRQYKADVEQLRSDVVLGNWDAVKDYLETLPDNDARYAHQRILTQLGSESRVNPRSELYREGAVSHNQAQYLRPAEILLLSDASKNPLDDSAIKSLARLVSSDAPMPASFFDQLKKGTRYFGIDDHEKRVATAKFLLAAELLDEVKEFLPDESGARDLPDYAALNIIGQYHSASHANDAGKEHLPRAWDLCLEIIGAKEAPLNQKTIALYRALGLVPQLEGSTGKDWLDKTFSNTSAEGFEIMTAVGTQVAQTRNHRDVAYRFEQLELQASAVNALLGGQKELQPWKEILTIYALNWNAEAERSIKGDRNADNQPRIQYDNFGNRYYSSVDRYASQNSRNVPFIPTAELLKVRPTSEWLAAIDAPIKLDALAATVGLQLNAKQEDSALPLLKELVDHRPEVATQLVRKMISVWAANNNPNRPNTSRSRYSYFYGFNQAAESIPLTRSMQERNLVKLGEFVAQVTALGLEDNFEDELAGAFIQAHSQAEVWRVESLESVFGPIDDLNPETIVSLLAKMRINLATLWPNPKVQQQAKTKRTDKELKAQVLKGYRTARELCAQAVEKHSDSWALDIQLAALQYEESNYLAALGSHPDHMGTKVKSLAALQAACGKYIDTLPLEQTDEESIEPFSVWFNAALGSPNLGALKGEHQPVLGEFSKIKAALESVPQECRDRHMASFADLLDGRLPNVGPDLKYRFLEMALSITGDHEKIAESSKVFQYYRDLNTEIKLDVSLDGKDQIDPDQPFGLSVNLLHTREIERESGGFNKYLVNQNSQRYAYNYGRPTEDYRDKFEKGARAVLEEHFEVLSLTFHNPKVDSRTTAEEGWTLTPYAYFLLKTKGPEVDTIPSLKIDLDFLDTSGSVILPVASSVIPIDASEAAAPRPYRDLSLSMILDERESAENNLLNLEIRAAGHGLMPSLEQLIELPIANFSVVEIEDRELQIEELDAETDDLAPISSHEWRLTLRPKDDALPTEFEFPTVLASLSDKQGEGLTLQKYADVDLVPVEAVTSLASGSPHSNAMWLWLLLSAVIAIVVLFIFLPKNRKHEVRDGVVAPHQISAVSVLSFLEKIRGDGSLVEVELQELDQEIISLREGAFAPEAKRPTTNDLREIANRWETAANKAA